MRVQLILAGKEALEHEDNTLCYIFCRSLKMKGFSATEQNQTVGIKNYSPVKKKVRTKI